MLSISAIIPVYNRERSIGAAIESVLTQTRPPSEVIVVDDGSTDATAEVVGRYGSGVRLITQANAGQAVARNRGVLASSGEWLAFLDSDDLWSPKKIEHQTAFIEQHPDVNVMFHDLMLKSQAGEQIQSLNSHLARVYRRPKLATGHIQNAAEIVVRSGDILFTSTLMLRRSVFEQAGGYRCEFRRCQDVDLHLRLTRHARFAFLDEVLTEKDWASNADAEMTYTRRIELLRRFRMESEWLHDRPGASLASHHLGQCCYALAGNLRRSGRLMDALKCYVRGWHHARKGR